MTQYKIYEKGSSTSALNSANQICDVASSGPGRAFEFEYVGWSAESGGNPAVDYYVVGDNSDLSA